LNASACAADGGNIDRAAIFFSRSAPMSWSRRSGLELAMMLASRLLALRRLGYQGKIVSFEPLVECICEINGTIC
jgi:hypothetical protein